MEKIRNLTLKRAILFYVAIGLIISFFLSALLTRSAERAQQRIMDKYVEVGQYEEMVEILQGYGYIIASPRINPEGLESTERVLVEVYDFIMTWSSLIISMLGAILSVFIFYQQKIKAPVEELAYSSQLIARDELNFTICYENKDELGTLCAQFERMRHQLQQNNQKLWQMIEEEKVLKSAIAHDIRSPLAVLMGYQETLMEFVPNGEMKTDEILEIIESCAQQTKRLQNFVQTMQQLNRLEEREVCYHPVRPEQLAVDLSQTARHICRDIHYTINQHFTASHLSVDQSIVAEVYENLLENAVRYAKASIIIEMKATDNHFEIEVRDDGSGFAQDSDSLTKRHVHSDINDELNHSGLGLYIARLYCEKHGGRLYLDNPPQGGARARATFYGQ